MRLADNLLRERCLEVEELLALGKLQLARGDTRRA